MAAATATAKTGDFDTDNVANPLKSRVALVTVVGDYTAVTYTSGVPDADTGVTVAPSVFGFTEVIALTDLQAAPSTVNVRSAGRRSGVHTLAVYDPATGLELEDEDAIASTTVLLLALGH